jgi:hypothetical protein
MRLLGVTAMGAAFAGCGGGQEVVHVSPALPAAASITLAPGVVVDPATSLVYVADDRGGSDAIDLATGEVRWHTDAVAVPLASDGGELLGLVENIAACGEAPYPQALHVARVRDGATVFRGEPIALPRDLHVGMNSGDVILVDGAVAGGELRLEVRGFFVPGADPLPRDPDEERGPSRGPFTKGSVAVDARTGAVTGRLRSEDVTWERRQELLRDPRVEHRRLGDDARALRSARYGLASAWHAPNELVSVPILHGHSLLTFAYEHREASRLGCELADVRIDRWTESGTADGSFELGRSCVPIAVMDHDIVMQYELAPGMRQTITFSSLSSGVRLAHRARDHRMAPRRRRGRRARRHRQRGLARRVGRVPDDAAHRRGIRCDGRTALDARRAPPAHVGQRARGVARPESRISNRSAIVSARSATTAVPFPYWMERHAPRGSLDGLVLPHTVGPHARGLWARDAQRRR